MLVFSSPGDQGRGRQTLEILTALSLVSAAGSSTRPGCWVVALSKCYGGCCMASHPQPPNACVKPRAPTAGVTPLPLSDKSLIWEIRKSRNLWEFLSF